MTLDKAMSELKALGSEKQRAHNAKQGVGENQFGAKMGDIRNVVKKIKTDHGLARKLWETGNLDARLLACLILRPKELSTEELDQMVRSVEYSPTADYSQLADWLNSYVVKQHPDREALRQRWLEDSHPMAARAAWSLTSDAASKAPDSLDLDKLLDRIEAEMKDAPAPAMWTMNFALANIGIHSPAHRKRALEIGEKLGVYRDFPTPKGCTSPFAPIWINYMVAQQEG